MQAAKRGWPTCACWPSRFSGCPTSPSKPTPTTKAICTAPSAGVEISKSLKGKNLKVEADMVKLEGPIKLCGLYEVKLALGYEIETTVKVMVVPIKQTEKK